METVINSNEIDESFVERIRKLYVNKKVRITVEEVKSFEEMSGEEQLSRIKAMRERHPPFYVSDEIDISELANQVNA